MKKKLLSLVVCSALLLSISREMEAGFVLFTLSTLPLVITEVTMIFGIFKGLNYAFDNICQNINYTPQNSIDESRELINNINATYGPMLAIENFDTGELFLEQLAHAKNPDYSAHKYIDDCAKNIKNLSWYQKKLRQHKRQSKKKNISIKLCDDIKQTLAEIEQLKSKMELLHKTFVEHRSYFLLQEHLDSINYQIDTSHEPSKNALKKLQSLQAKVDLKKYPALQEKVRTVPLVA